MPNPVVQMSLRDNPLVRSLSTCVRNEEQYLQRRLLAVCDSIGLGLAGETEELQTSFKSKPG